MSNSLDPDQVRTDILSALIWVQTVRKGYQQTTKVAASKDVIFEPWHGISNNVVCATSKASDQPANRRSLIRASAGGLNILRVLSY